MTRLAIILAAALVAGCATNSPVKVKVSGDSFCKVYRKLSWVPADTPPTIDGIRRENAKHDRVCRRAR